jgi:cell division septation protein DedD
MRLLTLTAKNISGLCWIFILALLVSGCASDLQTRVAGNLNSLSKDQTVAILPIETSDLGQQEMAEMFRQGLYANLKQSKFNLLEKYIVDGLLKQNNLTNPAGFLVINPMQFGEILGADAIIFSRINKVERNYLIVHSSIELSISIQMVDTRTGEILWRAEQTEHDFSGIGKIPTGITTALLAPIQFVTNKFNLSKMTSKMLDKLTALVKKPENAETGTKFENMVIAKNATTDLKKIKELQQLKSEWAQALVLDEKTEVLQDKISNHNEIMTQESDPASLTPDTAGNIQNKGLPTLAAHPAAVEAEMSSLPVTPVTIEQKVETPRPFNALKATLVVPAHIGNQQEPHREKGKKVLPPVFYTVQVGAYKTKAYAQGLSTKLLKKGYHAFVTRHGKEIYRVQVDKFSSKTDAIKLSQKIQETENIKTFVTQITAG